MQFFYPFWRAARYTDELHNDATTLSLHGAYEGGIGASPRAPLVAFGHAKERPDLLTELGKESSQFRGLALGWSLMVPARGRRQNAQGSRLADGAVGGIAHATGDLWEPYRFLTRRRGRRCGRYLPSRPTGFGQASYDAAVLWDGSVAVYRFLWTVEVPWDQATRVEARDFCAWLGVTGKPQRPHWRHPETAVDSQHPIVQRRRTR